MNSTHEILSLGDYERKMKKYENCGDSFILPDMFTVVRIDAHRIIPQRWKDFPDERYPLSEEFANALIQTAHFVLCCEMKFTCAFIHGDEISFVLDTKDRGSERRKARIISMISSIASTGFFNAFNRPVAFHAKLSELPTRSHLLDYLLWQKKVAERNFFSRTVGIELEKRKTPKEDITKLINSGLEAMNTRLEELGVPTEDLPPELKHGAILYWDAVVDDNIKELRNLLMEDDEYLSFLGPIIDQPGRRITFGPQFVNITPIQKPEIGASKPPTPKTTFKGKSRDLGARTRRFKI